MATIFENKRGIVHLTDEQINQKAKYILDFLSKIHPELLSRERYKYTGTKDIAVHLKAVFRDTNSEVEEIKRNKGKYYNCVYQNIFRYNETGEKSLINFLKMLNNSGRAYCLYYGIHSFDDNVAGTKKIEDKRLDNARFVKNQLTKKNAQGTHILIADFDKISYEDFLLVKSKFPFNTIDIFTGHGFQSIILLNEYVRIKDKKALEQFVATMYEKGFDIDTTARDEARVMRMPFMFNAKEHMKESNITWSTFILNNTDTKYSLDEVFALLDNLETVRSFEEDILKKKKDKDKEKENIVEDLTVEYKEEIRLRDKNLVDIDFLIQTYPQLSINKLQKPIQLLLQGFREGYAENSLMFLVNYFKFFGYSETKIKSILLPLAKLDTYNYAWEEGIVKEKINKFYYYKDKKNSMVSIYTNNLSREYGKLDFAKEFELVGSKLKINNKFFDDLSIPDSNSNTLKSDITPVSMYLLLALLVNSHRHNNYNYDIDDIIKVSSLSRRTVERALKPLVNHSYIIKDNNHISRLGDKKTYSVSSKIYDVDKNFTLIPIQDIDNLISKVKLKDMNEREFQICCYLKYRIYQGIDSIILSQQDIAKDLLLNRTMVSKVLSSLDEKRYIIREVVDMNNKGTFVYKYKLTF